MKIAYAYSSPKQVQNQILLLGVAVPGSDFATVQLQAANHIRGHSGGNANRRRDAKEAVTVTLL